MKKLTEAYQCECGAIYKEKDYKITIYPCQICEKEICFECGFVSNMLQCWDCAKKEIKEKETLKGCICRCCETQIRLEDFTDELSLKEFEISGLCQDCQNDLFEEKKDDKTKIDKLENIGTCSFKDHPGINLVMVKIINKVNEIIEEINKK